MQFSLSSLLEQLERFAIPSELVLVEWNPPEDTPLLKDVLNWPAGLRSCSIRNIVVPPSIHQRYDGSDRYMVHGAAAENAGIRRARGEFVLTGTIDLLYSDELMAHLASRSLRKGCIYRTDRCGVDKNVVHCESPEERLDFCRQNVLFIQSRRSSVSTDLPNLHTRGAGDFLLLSRENWHLLHGIPEIDLPSARVDGLLCYMAYAASFEEVMLDDPMRLYHIEHDSKFGARLKLSKSWLEKLLASLKVPGFLSGRILQVYHVFVPRHRRAEVYGVRTLSPHEYRRLRRDVVSGKRSYVFNDDDWGLGIETLAECYVSTADWDSMPAGNEAE